MAFSVQVRLVESAATNGSKSSSTLVHAEAEYEFSTLELAREAEQAACNGAVLLMPRRSKARSDEDWVDHPDRSDAADV
jgi:hypothetical protein